VLALWVGGLILVAIIHTKVEMEPSFKNAKPHQQFFGRYITFFLIAQVQALITVLSAHIRFYSGWQHPAVVLCSAF